jgi:hypothetical protein
MMKFADKFRERLQGASPNDRVKLEEAIKQKKS